MHCSPAYGGFIIRPARSCDAESIWRTHVRSIRILCARHYSARQIEAWAGPKKPEDYLDALEHLEAMYVAEEAGQVIGFACREGDELKGLYVAPSFMGHRVGAALLQRVEIDAMAGGITSLRLQSTLNATSFYKRHGYLAGEPVCRLMNGVEIPCVPMTKALTAAG